MLSKSDFKAFLVKKRTVQMNLDHAQYDLSNVKVQIELQQMIVLFQTFGILVCKLDSSIRQN